MLSELTEGVKKGADKQPLNELRVSLRRIVERRTDHSLTT